jgi:hypothetical protein
VNAAAPSCTILFYAVLYTDTAAPALLLLPLLMYAIQPTALILRGMVSLSCTRACRAVLLKTTMQVIGATGFSFVGDFCDIQKVLRHSSIRLGAVLRGHGHLSNRVTSLLCWCWLCESSPTKATHQLIILTPSLLSLLTCMSATMWQALGNCNI